MSPDGLTPLPNSPPIQLLDRESSEGDGPLVEAPSLVKVGGTYVLFYSTGCTRDADYDVRVAIASDVQGPYTRRGKLLKTGDYGVFAPGSVTVRPSAFAQELALSQQGFSGDDGIVQYAGQTGLGPQGQIMWDIVFHGRVVTQIGAIRALFTAGLEFTFDENQLAAEKVKSGASKQRTTIVKLIDG